MCPRPRRSRAAPHPTPPPPNPHDALAKVVLSQPAHAASWLAHVLPAPLSQRIDWPSLTLLPGSFVDPALRESHTDLLFSVRIDDRNAELYLLFEHLSRSQRGAALRMARYITRVLERASAKHPRRALPAVVPVVLHHSERGWTAPHSLECSYRLSDQIADAIGPHLLRLHLVVHDLGAIPDERLYTEPSNAVVRLTQWALKHGRSASLLHRGPRVARLFLDVLGAPSGMRALAAVMQYIGRMTGKPPAEVREHIASMLGPSHAEIAMNAYQKYEAKLLTDAHARGLREGREEGREEGLLGAKADSVLAVLAARGLRVTATVAKRVRACRDLAVLDAWLRRACFVAKASELFAEA